MPSKKNAVFTGKSTFLKNQYLIYVIFFFLNGKIFRIKQATHHSSFFQRYLTPQKSPLFVQKTTPYSLFQTRAQH
jgi:hypothetical protein